MTQHDSLVTRIALPPAAANCIERHALALSRRALDEEVAALVAGRPGIGAVVIDSSGHVKLLRSGGSGPGEPRFTLSPGVYASIQEAIDAASNGEAVYIAAGKYREQLTISGKQLDLLGATGDDGSPLVTLESPEMAHLAVEPTVKGGEVTARCALLRVRKDAQVRVHNLIIDGRRQGWMFRRAYPDVEFQSIATDSVETTIERVETRGFDSTEAVRLLDGSGRLRAMYPTIQAGIDAALQGDELIIAPGRYAEDLRIEQPVTLTRARVDRTSERAGVKATVIGRVVVAAAAMSVALDGIAIEGPLEMEPLLGATASITLRNCRIVTRS